MTNQSNIDQEKKELHEHIVCNQFTGYKLTISTSIRRIDKLVDDLIWKRNCYYAQYNRTDDIEAQGYILESILSINKDLRKVIGI